MRQFTLKGLSILLLLPVLSVMAKPNRACTVSLFFDQKPSIDVFYAG